MNSELTLFSRINLARCAAERANANYRDETRFNGEYSTARLWADHRVTCCATRSGEVFNYCRS